jgi:TetR/AcrR family transcriptional repressor of nem operon
MIPPLYDKGGAMQLSESTSLTLMNSFSIYEKKHGFALNNIINEIGDYETAYQEALKHH